MERPINLGPRMESEYQEAKRFLEDFQEANEVLLRDDYFSGLEEDQIGDEYDTCDCESAGYQVLKQLIG